MFYWARKENLSFIGCKKEKGSKKQYFGQGKIEFGQGKVREFCCWLYHMNFGLESAAVIWLILESILGFDPSLEVTDPRYMYFLVLDCL